MPWVVVRHAPTTASHVNPKKATTRRLLLNTALTRKKKRRLLEETAKGYVHLRLSRSDYNFLMDKLIG